MIHKDILNTDKWQKKIRVYIHFGPEQSYKNRILLRLIENLIKNVSDLNEKVNRLEEGKVMFNTREEPYEERRKTCGKCVYQYEDQDIVDSMCYLCKRNPVDNRTDWFEEEQGEKKMKDLSKEHYDFSCYLIKYDREIIFLDKLVYDKDSLVNIDHSVVPLCWDHRHNDPENIIGKVLLEDREDGVYVYGKLFDNAAKFDVKRLIEAKDVYISPYINQVKIKNHHITYGKVREVSLVIARVDPNECYRPVWNGMEEN